MKELKDIIDELDILTLFQKDFCKRIIWFTINKGEFKYIKSYIYKLYERIMTPDEIEREIKNMEEAAVIFVENKKTIYKGEYITFKKMAVNEYGIRKLYDKTLLDSYNILLKNAIVNENFEEAAEIRDEIQKFAEQYETK